MKKIFYISGLVLTMMVPSWLMAQRGVNRGNSKQVFITRSMLERDEYELQRFSRDFQAYQRAVSRREVRRAGIIQQELLNDMHREIAQSERKVELAARELGRTRSQTRRRPSGAYERRYQSRDDHWDLDEAYRRLDIQRDLYRSALQSLQHRGRGKGQARGRSLMDQLYAFQATLEEDVRASRREFREERHEARRY